MHYACLIVGPDPERQLEPFADYLELPGYRQFLDDRDRELMAEHFGLAPTDLEALAARLPEWDESEGGVEDGRLFAWSTDNPDSKFDWYELGGRFDSYLRLEAPRQPGVVKRLFGGKPRWFVSQAPKADIVEAHLLNDPPAALLRAGTWHECPITRDPAELETWKGRFAELFAPIPGGELLTIADLHS